MPLNPDVKPAVYLNKTPIQQYGEISKQLRMAANHPGSRVGEVFEQIHNMVTEMSTPKEQVPLHQSIPPGNYRQLPKEVLDNAVAYSQRR